MAPLSYLLVVSLMGSTIKPKDVTFEIDKVSKLVENLAKAASNNEEFSLMDAMEKSYVKKGHEAKYFSNTLRDYILYGNVSSDEEGFILSMDYRDGINPKDNSIQENGNDYLALFVPRSKEALNTKKEEIQAMIERNLAKTYERKNNENSSIDKIKDDSFEESNTFDIFNSENKITNVEDDLADDVTSSGELDLEENAGTSESTILLQNSNIELDNDVVGSQENINSEEVISFTHEESDFDIKQDNLADQTLNNIHEYKLIEPEKIKNIPDTL